MCDSSCGDSDLLLDVVELRARAEKAEAKLEKVREWAWSEKDELDFDDLLEIVGRKDAS